MSDYSFLDQLLHRVALQSAAVAEMRFDMDQRMVRNDPEEVVEERHVFVSGLARDGTTVLMRNFYATGEFRSLTYRDMPLRAGAQPVAQDDAVLEEERRESRARMATGSSSTSIVRKAWTRCSGGFLPARRTSTKTI